MFNHKGLIDPLCVHCANFVTIMVKKMVLQEMYTFRMVHSTSSIANVVYGIAPRV